MAGIGLAQSSITFDASGTWVAPANVTSVTIQMWGAGAGAPVSTGSSTTEYGGGGGAFVASKIITVTPGKSYTVTIATGGTLAQTDAATTYFKDGTLELLYAYGGDYRYGAQASTGGNVSASYKGGDGGASANGASIWKYFGGGGAAGSSGGNGANGGKANTTTIGNGGVGINGAGSGGNGGSITSVNTQGAPGKKPGGGGGGNAGKGGNGRVIITYCTSPGSIETGHTVPYPAEFTTTDSVYNVVAGPGLTNPDYFWEQSTNNSTWTVASASIKQSYPLPNPNTATTTYYRRSAYTCASPYYTNSALIKVWSQANGLLNGTISGKVKSKNGSGVSGITITVQKQVALKGSPLSKTYTATTGTDGTYSINNIFYGDLGNGDPNSVTFNITPSKTGHKFSPTLTATLSNTNPTVSGKEFTDSTVYSITGTVTQTCTGCVNGFTSVVEKGVKISTTNTFTTTGDDGNYGITVTDPGTYTLTPTYLNHIFTPATRTATIVNKDTAGLNFTDATTKTISGVFKAGCGQYIGTVKLTFTDTGAVTHFKKEVTTSNTGAYSISLPARTYKVSVSTFTKGSNGADITNNDLYNFFNVTIKDSLIRNIDSANATMDLIYRRPPVITVSLLDTTCTTNASTYVLFQQNIPKAFTINLYQGAQSIGCKMVTDTNRIKLITNVKGDDINETLYYSQTNGNASVSLKPGSPNIVAPYLKYFNLTYTDKYNRAATPITRNVVVTGIKTDPGTFTTVSPEIPLLILHDPPGDNSYSFWESGTTTQTGIRFYANSSTGESTWAEVKLGARTLNGIGVAIESAAWGQVSGGLEMVATTNTANEPILSTTISQYYSTADNSNITGDAGDVYIGAALNLLYSVAHELKYTDACVLGVQNSLIIADSGFATTYTYSEDHIVNNVMPTLQTFIDNEADTLKKADYENQLSVWQQVVNNNTANKNKAKFDKNISFDGTTGPQTSTTSSSSTNSSTIEFGLAINGTVALELGFELGGSGGKAGEIVNFKTETGNIYTYDTLVQTTTGYTIDDDDDGDYFSVDIKKDPVYNTPVFVLVAGTASCPPEPVAQKRDACQLLIPQPVQSGIPADGEAIFILNLSNTSESGETRTYELSFVQASNPNGAIVTIGGSPVILPIPYTIGYLQSVQVTVTVKKPAGSIYSFEGLQFMLTDDCDGSVSKTNTISANFISTCSGITMAAPGNNWVTKTADNNSLAIQFNGYTLSNLQSVSLEYSAAGTSSWVTAFTKYQFEITDPNSTTVNWDVSAIADGGYDIRLKLTCGNGTVYSTRVSGIIDRRAPSLLGNPEPTDDNYVAGDVISMSYTETIDNTNLNSNKVELRRLSNNTVIPVQVSGFENKLVIVPVTSISGFAGDSMRLIVKDITDAYGNLKTSPDTSRFTVGVTVVGTGTKLVTISTVKTSMLENASGTMDVLFTLPVTAVNDVQVNFTIAGAALYTTDYIVTYFPNQPLSTSFNGIQGNIVIPKNSTQAILKIDPVGDALQEANESLIFTLSEGGDYVIGSVISVTDTIKNDDLAPPVITANRPTTFCTGDSVVLSTASAFAYLWSTGATTQSITVKTTGSYTVTIFDALGSTGISVPTQVTVNTKPNPVITGAPVICSGTPAILNAGAGYAAYLWSNGVTTQTNSVTAAGIYTVIVTNASGCSATSAPDTVKTSTKPVPVISASGSTSNVCPGQSVTLDAGAGATAYLWSTSATSRTIVVSTAGSYTVTVTNNAGCSGTSAAVAVSYQTCPKPTSPVVTNLAKTTATLGWTAPASCATGYQVQYRKVGTTTWTTLTPTITSVNITGLTAATTYEWRLQTACVQTPFTGSGYIAGSNFTTTTVAAVFAGTSVESSTAAGGFTAMVYPNPAKNSALLKVAGTDKEMNVIITEVMGKVLWKSTKLNTSQVQLPVAHLTAGVYLVTVTSGTKSIVVKLVKE